MYTTNIHMVHMYVCMGMYSTDIRAGAMVECRLWLDSLYLASNYLNSFDNRLNRGIVNKCSENARKEYKTFTDGWLSRILAKYNNNIAIVLVISSTI